MTPDQLDLARVLANHRTPSWRWTPGMRGARPGARGDIVEWMQVATTEHGMPRAWAAWSCEDDLPEWCSERGDGWPEDAVVDITDIGTAGHILGLLGTALVDVVQRPGPVWHVRRRDVDGATEGHRGATLGEAAARALLSAWADGGEVGR
jgi:hypothetical protein